MIDLVKLADDAPFGRLEIPKAAINLIRTADANGWDVGAGWGTSMSDEPFLTVAVRRTDPEIYAKLTWHTRDLEAGKLRLFSKIWRKEQITKPTEGHPNWETIVERGWYWRDLASLKTLTETITQRPVKGDQE